jgi:hypothetical protein
MVVSVGGINTPEGEIEIQRERQREREREDDDDDEDNDDDDDATYGPTVASIASVQRD